LKSTGITRKVDELGRIVLPIELRRTLGIEIKDPMAIYVDGDNVVLKRYESGCIFCGSYPDDVKAFKSRLVCQDCRDQLLSNATSKS